MNLKSNFELNNSSYDSVFNQSTRKHVQDACFVSKEDSNLDLSLV